MNKPIPKQSRFPGSMSSQEFAQRQARWARSDPVMAKFKRVLVDGEAIADVAESAGTHRHGLLKEIKRWLAQSAPPAEDTP